MCFYLVFWLFISTFAGDLNLNIYCRYDQHYFSGRFCSLV